VSDPRIASLDIETFGKLVGYPHQTCFTPRRCIYIDGVKPHDLCLCAALTLPTFDPREDPSTPWNAARIAQLVPGPTFIFDLRLRAHIHVLCRWLSYVDTLLGMNLQFDIGFLRYFSPVLRSLLSGQHLILELGVINYLECEMRPERSLKSLGPVLGTHVYNESDLFEKLPDWPHLINYQAQDPHNTMLGAAFLAARIARSNSPDKLSPFCLRFYSDSIWSLLRMTENGVPFSHARSHTMLSTLTSTMHECEALASFNHAITLSGKGSDKSLSSFLAQVITTIGNSVDYSRLILTEKKAQVSLNEANRAYLSSLLPPDHPFQDAFSLISRHSRAEKLIGSYLYPMLLHKKARKSGRLNRSALLIPQPGVPHPCPLPLPSPPPSEKPPATSKTAASSNPAPPSRSKRTKKKTALPSSLTSADLASAPPPSTCSTEPPSSLSTKPSALISTFPDGAHPDIPGQSFLPF
jgi:hypothetical protein